MTAFAVPSNLAVSENGFLFVPTSGETFTLNKLGISIFKLMQKGADTEEIIDALLEEYDIDKTTLEKDFTDFVNQLKHHNLIEEK
ncbi:MAG: hypothetical protein SCALA702_22390 [Melioribacteraceae bacterium]|nr:MAG: hypothetical protein SCALA702_22390 [Melioribacteraceae bacterium]